MPGGSELQWSDIRDNIKASKVKNFSTAVERN